MSIWRRNSRDARRAAIPLMIALLVWTGPLSAGAWNSLQADPDRPLVIDRAGILDDGQERSAVNDVYRLNLYGIPTQVVTEPVGLDQSQADARADELRVSQGIETFPGANDGLLFYVSTDLYDQTNIVMSISIGSQTLPRNGFDVDSLVDIHDRIVTTQIALGHPARAIVYSLREMIYLEQYVPPPPPVISGWRSDAQPVSDVLGPMLAVTGSAWLLWTRRSNSAPVGIAGSPRRLIAMGALAASLVVVAVATRSESSVLAAVGLSGLVIWQSAAWERTPSPNGPRAMLVSPRRPGSRRRVRSARTAAR